MLEYDPLVHTTDSLAGEIERIYSARPQTLLVGSIGRSAIHSNLTGYYLSEFSNANPLSRPDGTARDVDVIDLHSVQASTFLPYEVDTTSFGSPIVSIERDGQDWVLKSAKKNFEAALHPSVMEPVEAEILDGVKVITLPAQTHLYLLGLKGIIRDKDIQSREALRKVMAQKGIPAADDERYAPFIDLKNIWLEDSVIKARERYRRVVPAGIRKHMKPAHRAAMKLLGR